MMFMVIYLHSGNKEFRITSTHETVEEATTLAERLCKLYSSKDEPCEKRTGTYEMGGGDPNYICNYDCFFVFKIPSMGYRQFGYLEDILDK